jgi:hypothetical protein
MTSASLLSAVPDPDLLIDHDDSDEEADLLSTDTHPHSCTYCDSGQSHPRFLYFISTRPSHITDAEVVNKFHNHIGCSRQPLARIATHNRDKMFKVGAKITRAGAGCWAAEMVLGPIPRGQGQALKDLWKTSYRTITRRLLAGTLIASTYELEVFVRDASTQGLILTLINKLEPTSHAVDRSQRHLGIIGSDVRDVSIQRQPAIQLTQPQGYGNRERQQASRQQMVPQMGSVVLRGDDDKDVDQLQYTTEDQEIQG